MGLVAGAFRALERMMLDVHFLPWKLSKPAAA